jgi:hypothetical protein
VHGTSDREQFTQVVGHDAALVGWAHVADVAQEICRQSEPNRMRSTLMWSSSREMLSSWNGVTHTRS